MSKDKIEVTKKMSLISASLSTLTLIQPGKGRFALAYMSPDYLHGSHAGLPGWIRVKVINYENDH